MVLIVREGCSEFQFNVRERREDSEAHWHDADCLPRCLLQELESKQPSFTNQHLQEIKERNDVNFIRAKVREWGLEHWTKYASTDHVVNKEEMDGSILSNGSKNLWSDQIDSREYFFSVMEMKMLADMCNLEFQIYEIHPAEPQTLRRPVRVKGRVEPQISPCSDASITGIEVANSPLPVYLLLRSPVHDDDSICHYDSLELLPSRSVKDAEIISVLRSKSFQQIKRLALLWNRIPYCRSEMYDFIDCKDETFHGLFAAIEDQLRQAGYVPHRDNSSHVVRKVLEWIEENGDQDSVRSLPAKDPYALLGSDDTDRRITRTSISKLKKISELFPDIPNKLPALEESTVSAIIFATCCIFGVRIAVLIPSNPNKRCWKIWDPLDKPQGSVSESRILMLCNPKDLKYYSIIKCEALEDAELQPNILADVGTSDHSSSSDTDAGDDGLTDMPVTVEPKNLAWIVRCDNPQCSKLRMLSVSGSLVFEERITELESEYKAKKRAKPDRTNTEEFDDQSHLTHWKCGDDQGAIIVENKCSDAGIFELVEQFFNQETGSPTKTGKRKNKSLQRKRSSKCNLNCFHKEIDGNLIQLGFLFTAVQVIGSFEAATSDLWSAMTQLLGASPRRWKRLKAIYEELFLKSRLNIRGGINLESFLKSNSDVMKTVQKNSKEVVAVLGLQESKLNEAVDNVGPLGDAARFPPLYVKPALNPVRSEEIREILSQFGKVASIYAARAEDAGRPWASCFSEVIEVVNSACSVKKRIPLVMIGDSATGKSYILDSILRFSECDKYGYSQGNIIEEGQDMEAVQLAWEIKGTVQRQASDEAGQGTPDEGHDFREASFIFQVTEDILESFCCEKMIQDELGSKVLLSTFCIDGTRQCIPPFILPWGNVDDGTTACSIAIRRSQRYSLVIEYISHGDLKERWKQFSEDDESKDDDQLISEVKDCFGWESDEQARNYLLEQVFDLEEDFAQSLRCAVQRNTLAFCGFGSCAIKDRVFIRNLVHSCQGLNEPCLHVLDCPARESNPPDHPLLSCDNGRRVEFGKRTRAALKKLTVFVPCIVAPSKEGELIDTAGSNDGNILRQVVMDLALESADAVIVAVNKNLDNSKGAMDALITSQAMKHVMTSIAKGEMPVARVSILHNIEKPLLDKGDRNSLLDIIHTGYTHERSNEARKSTEKGIKNVIKKLMSNLEFASTQTAEGLTQHLLAKNALPLLFPAVTLFSSLMMNTENDPEKGGRQEKERLEAMARTGMYDLLGTIEQFLRGNTLRQVQEVKKALEKLTQELQNAKKSCDEWLKTRHRSKHPGRCRTATQRETEAWRREAKEYVPKFQETIRQAGDAFAEFVSKRLAESEKALVSSETLKLKVCDMTKELKTLPCALSTEKLNNFLAQRKVKAVLTEALRFCKGEMESIEQSAKEEMHSILKAICDDVKEFFADKGWALGTQMNILPAKLEMAIPKILEEVICKVDKRICELTCDVVSKSMMDTTQILSVAFSKRLRTFVRGMKNSSDASTFDMRLIDFVFRDPFRNEIGTGVVSRVRKDLIVQDQMKLPLNSATQFLCHLGLQNQRKGSKKNTFHQLSLFLLNHQVFNEGAAISAAIEDSEHLQTILEALEDLRSTLMETSAVWESQCECTSVGRCLSETIRMQRVSEQLSEACGFDVDDEPSCWHPLVQNAFIDRTCIWNSHVPDIGFRFFCADDDLRAASDQTIGQNHDDFHRRYEEMNAYFSIQSRLRIQKPNLKRNATPSHLFKIYSEIAGISSSQKAIKVLRNLVAYQVIKFSEKKVVSNYLKSRNQSIVEYCTSICLDSTYPDIFSLVLLVEYFKRPLNLYVPWQPNPLRIWPGILEQGEKGRGPADAIAYFGFMADRDGPRYLFSSIEERRRTRSDSQNQTSDHDSSEPSDTPEYTRMDSVLSVRSINDDLVPQSPTTPGMEIRSPSPALPTDDHENYDVLEDVTEAYHYATFCISDWRNVENNENHVSYFLPKLIDYPGISDARFGILCKKYAQFVERYVFRRGCPRKGMEPDSEYQRWNCVPYDDSISHTDNFIAVFDGVGQGGCMSGKFARSLSTECLRQADKAVPESITFQPNYNRSKSILLEAHAQSLMHVHRLNRDELKLWKTWRIEGGKNFSRPSAVALVLSLCKKPDGKHEIHSAIHGDCQWALFRKVSATLFKCLHLSEPKYYDRSVSNPVPFQLTAERNSIEDPEPPCIYSQEVMEGDLILAASDGFFDNCLRIDKSVEQHALQECLEHIVNSGSSGGVCGIGNALRAHACTNMDNGGKKDDLTIFLGRVAFGLENLSGAAQTGEYALDDPPRRESYEDDAEGIARGRETYVRAHVRPKTRSR